MGMGFSRGGHRDSSRLGLALHRELCNVDSILILSILPIILLVYSFYP